jgi:hypothetical protein
MTVAIRVAFGTVAARQCRADPLRIPASGKRGTSAGARTTAGVPCRHRPTHANIAADANSGPIAPERQLRPTQLRDRITVPPG